MFWLNIKKHYHRIQETSLCCKYHVVSADFICCTMDKTMITKIKLTSWEIKTLTRTRIREDVSCLYKSHDQNPTEKTETKPKMQMNCELTQQQSMWRISEPSNMTRGKNTFTSSINHHCMLFVCPGVLELFAVSQGVIGIKGVYSNRFLAMNKRGRLHATVSIWNTSQTTSVCRPALTVCVYTFRIKLILKIGLKLH